MEEVKQLPVGYSNAPLSKKLGLKANFRVILLDVPDTYFEILGKEPGDLNIADNIDEPVDFIHLFVSRAIEVVEQIPFLKLRLKPSGMLWVSWPKKTSKIQTDVNYQVIQRVARLTKLVDVKVCAVDNTWSAVKLMHRKKDRK